MKRFISFFILTLFICSNLGLAQLVTIDAEKDAFWGSLTGPGDGYVGLPVEAAMMGEPYGPEDISALCWIGWDMDFLYFYAEVTDDIIQVNNATIYENDCIELKIDPDPTMETTTGVAAVRLSAWGEDDADVPEGVDNIDKGAEIEPGYTFVDGEDYARKEVDTDDRYGYNLEFRLPWEVIIREGKEVAVDVGEIFGLAINVMDNDIAAREKQLQWSAGMTDPVWANPQLHGTATFLADNKIQLDPVNSAGGPDPVADPAWFIPPAQGGGEFNITIDAEKDAFWGSLTGPDDGYIQLMPDAFILGPPEDPEDLSALCWFGWDMDFLYFYAEVTDDIVQVNNATTYENDAIELKIDPDPTMETTTGVAAVRLSAWGEDDADVPEGVDNIDKGAEIEPGYTFVEGEDYARKEVDTDDRYGYNLEFRLPWEVIVREGKEVNVDTGEIFGLAVNLMDNDIAAREKMLQWSAGMADPVWANPQLHGTVEFLADHKLKLDPVNSAGGPDAVADPAWYIPPAQSAVRLETAAAVEDFRLQQNYPNPFNPSTTIDFAVKEQGRVELAIFDVLGRKVKTLVSESLPMGSYSAMWDGTDNAGSAVPSGVYVYRMTAGTYSSFRKLTFVQ